MGKIPDGRKRKYQRLSASVDMEAPTILEDKNQIQWQNGDLANSTSGTSELTGNSGKKGNLSKDIALHGSNPQQRETGSKKEFPLLQKLKQMKKHGKKGIASRKWLSANLSTGDLDVENDHAGLQQLHKLRTTVERLGGKLEDGWYVNSQRRSNNGIPFFSFISPTNVKFRSRIEVVRHLGLPARPPKNRSISVTGCLVPNNQLALVPYERRKKSLTKSSKIRGISNEPHLKNLRGHEFVVKVSHALKASKDVSDPKLTSISSLSASVVTQRCQDILRSIISTEKFAAVSNMFSGGAPSPSMDATLQLKGPSFLASSLDLKLIHLRLSTGAYGQSPDLFSTDIQQVWKNIIAAGHELVTLASSLAELSEGLYKQQIMSLFDGSPQKTVNLSNTGNHQSFDDTYVHAPVPERIIARAPEGTFLGESPADFSVKDLVGLKSWPSGCQATQARLQKQLLSKKAAAKARHQLSKKLRKSAAKAKELATSQGGLSSSSTDSVCQKCGLDQGAECIVCNNCQASYHPNCVTSISAANGWCCPLCFLNQANDDGCEWGTLSKGILDQDTQEELLLINSNATTEICQGLQKSTGKAGVCEACKKEDDNVLLCDACDAAYHMNCLSPAIESVPDGYWYCPTCDEAGKKLIVFQQDTDVHNCAVCERVSKELLNCAEHESTAQVFSKGTSPVYLAAERSVDLDHVYPDHTLNQGASEHCIETKAMDLDFLPGTGFICKLCGLDEGKKSILCSNCQNCYHLSCLRPVLKKRPRKTWYCPSCLCRVCKIDIDDNKILLCEACDEGYHTYCLTPPLSEIPEEAWYCRSCMEATASQTEGLKKKRKSNE